MKLSVITATYNAIQHLPDLVESLRKQTDKDFEWVVADGASTDGTVDYLKSITDLNLKLISQEDFGIYDALNRGIKASSGEFYLVLGADDSLTVDAVSEYKKAINNNIDIITSNFYHAGKLFKANRGPMWLTASAAFCSGHAVGSIFRKSLHEKFGYYSKRFPIAADQYFMIKAYLGGAVVKEINVVTGVFGDGGVSSLDAIGIITELYRILLELGVNKYLLTFIFYIRILKALLQAKRTLK
ncbi:glycosyltransferase [Pseudomonas wenzhouensis]|uniref:glycosyltransferase n=1 Tax=Pseudomonas wenzhouensis TaxID=2906062 RepID=UPI001E4173B1|nr:glycosyltransferase [Pseudomonas wenzhouensis]UFQ99158.1 glycosyltransferase [Pseudomonas wenzhouensis]